MGTDDQPNRREVTDATMPTTPPPQAPSRNPRHGSQTLEASDSKPANCQSASLKDSKHATGCHSPFVQDGRQSLPGTPAGGDSNHSICPSAMGGRRTPAKCRTPRASDANPTKCQSPMILGDRKETRRQSPMVFGDARDTIRQSPRLLRDAKETHRQSPLVLDANKTHRQSPLVLDSNQTHRQSPLVLDSNQTHRQSPLILDSNQTHRQTPRNSDANQTHRQSPLVVDAIQAKCPTPIVTDGDRNCSHSRAETQEIFDSAAAQPESHSPCVAEASLDAASGVCHGLPRGYPRDFTPNEVRQAAIVKMRGQRDLLSMEGPQPAQSYERVHYPRNRWFYYLDNAIEDAAAAQARRRPALSRGPRGSSMAELLSCDVEEETIPAQEVRRLRTRVPYRRNDWFYHLDNALEDAQRNDRMPGDQSSGVGIDKEEDGPAHCPQGSQDTIGKAPPDNWNCMGVGPSAPASKMKLPGVPSPTPGSPKGKLVQGSSSSRMRLQSSSSKPYLGAPSGEPSASMGKLLANSYQQEWMDEMERKATNPRPRVRRNTATSGKMDLLSTEYKTAFGPALFASKKEGKKWANVRSRWRNPVQKPASGCHCSGLEGPGSGISRELFPARRPDERFMLTKFKKVGPKTDTGQTRIRPTKTTC